MEFIPGWRTERVRVVRSESGTFALVDYRDNLLADDFQPWPPPEIAQKLSVSRKLEYFPLTERAALTATLGHYCDLQSVNSEDALTWNVFGRIGHESKERQAAFASRILGLLDISDTAPTAQVWVWRRLPHPETLSGNGPELDFGILIGRTLVLGENKWHGSVTQRQGLQQDRDQIEMRISFLRRSGRFLFPSVIRFVVLGVSFDGGMLEERSEVEGGIELRCTNLKWDALVDAVEGLGSKELRNYLNWKQEQGREHRSATPLLEKLELRAPSRVALMNSPDNFREQLGNVPDGLEFDTTEGSTVDTAMVFARSDEDLRCWLPAAVDRVRAGGKIWICWPLRNAELRTDIDRETVIAAGDRSQLVRVKAARIDRAWTALKFFRRR